MILFLYTYVKNRARTSGRFYAELKKRNDDNTFQLMDIARFTMVELKKNIDDASLIVFDNSLILSLNEIRILSKNFYTKNKPKEFYYEIWNLVDISQKPVFLMHPSSDLHTVNFGLPRNFYLSLLKRLSGIFWPYYRCPFETGGENDRYPFYTLKRFQLTKQDVINIWSEINSTVPISIDFPHCLDKDIMYKRPKRKIWDVIVPGVSYETRETALKCAKNAGLYVAPYVTYSRWLVLAPYLVYSNLIPKKFSSKFYQDKSFWYYSIMISRSSVSFACGSELKYFVRKFIEIPSFRSAMLAYPSDNFRDYGFEDGVHYLHCYPEETGEKAKYLLANKSMSEKMVNNAWDLVAKQHTSTERVNQVLSCLNSFLQGKLKWAGYYHGRFEIISQ